MRRTLTVMLVAFMRAILVCIAALALTACPSTWDDPNPDAYKPMPGAPCGNLGIPCLDMQGVYDHKCCNQGETCGGGLYSVGCPANGCCNIRQIPPTDVGAARAADAPAPVTVVVRHSQRPGL